MIYSDFAMLYHCIISGRLPENQQAINAYYKFMNNWKYISNILKHMQHKCKEEKLEKEIKEWTRQRTVI